MYHVSSMSLSLSTKLSIGSCFVEIVEKNIVTLMKDAPCI